MWMGTAHPDGVTAQSWGRHESVTCRRTPKQTRGADDGAPARGLTAKESKNVKASEMV